MELIVICLLSLSHSHMERSGVKMMIQGVDFGRGVGTGEVMRRKDTDVR